MFKTNKLKTSWTSSIYIVILLSIFLIHTNNSILTEDIDCPKGCECKKKDKMAVCKLSEKEKTILSYIPRLPYYVRYLRMENSKLEHVTKETMHNLSYITLESLIFQNCQIYYIDQDTFQDLQNQLQHLEINANMVAALNVSESFKSLNKSVIRTIALKYNFWDSIPVTMFKYLSGSQMSTLTICIFSMTEFDGFILSELYNLRKLTICTYRALQSISIRGMPLSLEHIILSGNNLRNVPKFCTHNSTLLPELRSLNLNRNVIKEIKSSSINCLHKLEKISLDNNYLIIIKDNTFNHLSSLKTLILSRQNAFIKKIEPYAFNSTTLSHLTLFNNIFDFKRSKTELIFKVCPQLKFLDLSKTTLKLGNIRLRQMFIPLKDLKVLLLSSVGIRALPSDLFHHLTSLERLYLDGNYITGWKDYMFRNITWLKQLNLKGNQITLINKTSFPVSFLASLKHLNLASNDFICSCDAMWFRDWIRKNKMVVLDEWPQSYKCKNPPAMINRLLKTFNPTVESCRVPMPIIAILEALGIVCGSIIILAIIAYKSRWHVRYWIYLLRVKRSGYKRIDGEDLDFLYDAFVVYCDEDKDWVHDLLVQKLELEQGYKLCIHFRDFDVGKLIVDNIMENMERSRKIIVVLSNAMAVSDWCQFEIRIAQNKFLKENSNILVLIMLEEVGSKHLSNTLKTLIITTTYAAWTDDKVGQKQFWDKLTNALTK